MSMAHGLEVRSPFLDTGLLTLPSPCPRHTSCEGSRSKRVLKAAVADIVPAPILSRRKQGFGIPLDRWFRTDLAAYMHATLLAPDARLNEHLVAEEIHRMVAEHESGARNHGHALWTLLTLEVFLRRHGW